MQIKYKLNTHEKKKKKSFANEIQSKYKLNTN
jgi:hypothetical protein